MKHCYVICENDKIPLSIYCRDNNIYYEKIRNLIDKDEITESELLKIKKDNNILSRQEAIDSLIGKQFGLLVVKGVYDRCNGIIYECECECQCKGKTIVYVKRKDLNSGKKDNCGCLTKKKQRDAKKKYNIYDLESEEYGVGYTSNTNIAFLFDKEDYDKIKDYCWFEHINNGINYIEARGNDGKTIKLHRLIMNVTDKIIKVDHIKHKAWDNRKSQLRLSTNQENCMNRNKPKNNTSGVSGVNYDSEKNKWRARLYYQNKTIHLGYFDTFEEAVKIRKEYEQKYYKEWSYDNSMKFKEV